MSKKDCLTCRRYVDCKDSRKAIGFYCSKYSRNRRNDEDFIDKLFGENKFEMPDLESGKLDFEKLELDLVDMIDNAIDPETQLVRDMKIDDGDIKLFPNYHEFVMSKNGMNLKPFSRQDYVLSMLFGEICPKCTDPKIKTVRDVPIKMKAAELPERIQYMNFGKCPKCKKTRLDFYRDHRMNPYQELSALVGQRAGKSTMLVSPAVCYMLHRLVKVPKPYEVYGLNPTPLVGTLVAQTFANAYEQLWLPIKTYLEASPWFNEYHDMLKGYENQYEEEFLKFQQQGIHYLHRQILLYPAGPNRKLLRGKTRWIGAIDEWDFFDNDDDSEQVRMNGQEVYKSLDNSMLSVRVGWKEKVKSGFVNIPNAYFITASSPQNSRGVLVQHVNKHLNSRKVYALHLPTWELHPKLTRKALQSFYDDDAQKAERDFGANPPLTSSGFLDDHEAIQNMVSKNLANRVKYEYIHKQSMDGKGLSRAAKITSKAMPGVIEPAILSLDAGLTANSFGLTIGHRNPNKHDPKKFICDIMIEIAPEQGKVKLNHSKIYKELIRPLIMSFNVSVVLADRWNSVKMLQDIEDEFRITSGMYSIKYKDFQMVKNHIMEGTVIVPQATKTLEEILKEDAGNYPHRYKYRPVDHFLLQCATVEDTGKDVEKGTKLTDDIWRAFALMMRFLVDDEYCQKFLKNRIKRQLNGGLVAADMLSHGKISIGGQGNYMPINRHAENVSRVAAASGGILINLNSTPNVFARNRG